jgi:hypothetical protein
MIYTFILKNASRIHKPIAEKLAIVFRKHKKKPSFILDIY